MNRNVMYTYQTRVIAQTKLPVVGIYGHTVKTFPRTEDEWSDHIYWLDYGYDVLDNIQSLSAHPTVVAM